MTYEVNFFKQDCEKNVLEKIAYIEHGVRNGVMTYAGLIALISEAEENYRNSYGRFAEEISIDPCFNEQCQAFGGELEKLTMEVKEATITMVSFLERAQALLNFSNVIR